MIIYNFFKYLILNIKYSRLLKQIYKDENLLSNLSKLFNVPFRIDKIGRVYAVINPFIVNGEYKPNDAIYEYNEFGMSTNEFIEHKIMDKLIIAEKFIHSNNLFELLTYKIKKLDNIGDYLFTFQPITLDECLNYSKKFFILYGILTIIAIIMLIIFL